MRRPRRNKYAISIPVLGSIIGSMSLTSKEVGLDQLPAAGPAAGVDPVLCLPHHGRLRLRDAGIGLARDLARAQASARSRTACCCGGIFLSFPLPLIAILTGWYTAEVGRQPWTVYGVLRTADAVTPFLTARGSDDLA